MMLLSYDSHGDIRLFKYICINLFLYITSKTPM